MDAWKSGNQDSRRSSIEIACDILEVVAAKTSKPTHIAYRANLSWTLVNKYLGNMVERGLVKKVDTGRRSAYEVTPSGRAVLSLFNEVKVGLGIIDRPGETVPGARETRTVSA
jgi:predicted transcriptional regulator